MEITHNPKIKICCIQSAEEGRTAIRYGASALGLVSEMPSGPGVIPEECIAQIASRVPPGIGTFLLTSRRKAEAIISQQHRCRTNAVQLCDRIEIAEYRELRNALPGIALLQVIHVVGKASLGEALAVEKFVDALLLDSGNQALPVKELGGTGRTHDWNISREIREAVGIPVFLAGGLNSGNVKEAIARVGPFGVDVCSGVRTNGHLDESKLAAFVDSIHSIEA